MRRLLIMTVAIISMVAVLGPHAAATTPTISPIEITSEGTLDGVCSFPLSLTTHLTGTRIRFFDESGAVVKALFQLTEQDTISANGKTLTSDPYSYSLEITAENGEITGFVTRGVGEKILLPDGTLFLSAGVIDFFAQGVDFSFTPDYGVTGDIDALCAAFLP
jgi:hypothetical protein